MLLLFVNLLRQNYRYGRMCSTSGCCCWRNKYITTLFLL